MIRKINVENYKSLPKLCLELGRVTVLIGANGSGKSNILEAIAFASAAAQNKLDNEFLISRGIRVTETQFMRSAFDKSLTVQHEAKISRQKDDTSTETVRAQGNFIKITVEGDDEVAFECELYPDEKTSYPRWRQSVPIQFKKAHDALIASRPENTQFIQELIEQAIAGIWQDRLTRPAGSLPGFLVFAPENSALRTFQAEGQILPLGIKGEGLFSHLKGLDSEHNRERLENIRTRLKLIEWFESFVIPENLSPGERVIKIQDQFIPGGVLFDQRSANEGFLFLLFYMTLFISPETPSFFSIDNIDNSLNPKICTELVRQINALASEYGKQVILTTHNPAVLDGLDLTDENQRLVVVDRDKKGHTRVRRVDPPKPTAGKQPISLSEAFMRGYIGGLPKNF
ncbi:MAG: AAA family ATPase [Schlesneria sp.]